MSAPTPPAGVSAGTSMTVGGTVVELDVTPSNGDVECALKCNGLDVTVTYEEDGGVMVEVESGKGRHHFTARALNKE